MMKTIFLMFFVPLVANAAGKIIDADIAPSGTANIARNKLAASTAHNACTFDSSGYIAGGVAPGSSTNFFQSNGTDWASAAAQNLTDVGTDGITITGGTGAVMSAASLSQHVADTTHNGYLSSTDWNTFNGKQSTISLGAFGSAPNGNAATFSTNTLTLQPADGSNPGGVSTVAQTFAGTKTFANIIDSGLTASSTVVTDGSKQLASLAYAVANTGSTIVDRDPNGNGYFVNAISTTGTIVSAGGITTLSSGSGRYQKVTGTSAQTIKMPDATTLVQGWIFEINNNSTQTVTIQDNSGGAITTMATGSYLFVINVNNSTIAGSWDVHWALPSGVGPGSTNADSTHFLRGDGTWQVPSAGGTAIAVLTKTTNYTILTGDFSTFRLLLEANCSAACTITLPAASNSGYEVQIINIGSATVTVSTAGSDTFGSTTDSTWVLLPGGNPQSGNTFVSNGGSRWDGF